MTAPVDRARSRPAHLIGRWLRLWRVEPVEIVSPLSAEAVQARLTAGLTTRRQLFQGQWGDPDARVVLGRVSERRIRLTARPRSVRNSWCPMFRGQLLHAGAGCRLVGTIGADDVPLVVIPAVMGSFGGGLVAVAGRAGWRDAAFLRGWLAERLQPSGPA